MTDQEINVAIAEMCGWVDVHINRIGMVVGKLPKSLHQNMEYDCPLYSHNLNDMQEAVDSLGIDAEDYAVYLWSHVCGGMPYASRKAMLKYCHATARQRAEAFLRTIGKWVDA